MARHLAMPLAALLFCCGVLGVLSQARAGQWPQTAAEWAWLTTYILFIILPPALSILWRRRGEELLRWLEKKYEETMPKRRG